MTAAAKEPRALLARRPHALALLAQLRELRAEIAGVRYWLANRPEDAIEAATAAAVARVRELRQQTTVVYEELLREHDKHALARQTVAELAHWAVDDHTAVVAELVLLEEAEPT